MSNPNQAPVNLNQASTNPAIMNEKFLSEFEALDAYLKLRKIFSDAQTHQDKARFDAELSAWQKKYPINIFSPELKHKISYMLSSKFLDSIIANFTFYREYYNKDYSYGLKKLRKIVEKATNSSQLKKELKSLNNEYPLEYLQQHYPHIVNELLDLSAKIQSQQLKKFASAIAFEQLENIVNFPNHYNSAGEFTEAIDKWQSNFPLSGFTNKFKSKVDSTLKTFLDEAKLQNLFPITVDLEEEPGQTVPLVKMSTINKKALDSFDKIANSNIGDSNSLFLWLYKYGPYINSFTDDTKQHICSQLFGKYGFELPGATKFAIPETEASSDSIISFDEYNSIETVKKEALVQFLGMISTEKPLTDVDILNLKNIYINSTIAEKTQSNINSFDKMASSSQNIKPTAYTSSDKAYLYPTNSIGGGNSLIIENTENEEEEEVPSITNNTYLSDTILEPEETYLEVNETVSEQEPNITDINLESEPLDKTSGSIILKPVSSVEDHEENANDIQEPTIIREVDPHIFTTSSSQKAKKVENEVETEEIETTEDKYRE